MTGLKLQSDWGTQIPPQVVNWTKHFAQSHQTLFLLEGGLGTRLFARNWIFRAPPQPLIFPTPMQIMLMTHAQYTVWLLGYPDLLTEV